MDIFYVFRPISQRLWFPCNKAVRPGNRTGRQWGPEWSGGTGGAGVGRGEAGRGGGTAVVRWGALY